MLCFWFKFWVFKEIFSTNLGNGLLSLLPHLVELLLAGLQQESNPVGVVVHGEVGQPGAGVGVNHDLVSALNIDDDVLAGHRVLVVVLVVLVEDGGDLLTVLADGKESLLVVVGGNVELEHVGSTAGASEDAGVDVEAACSGQQCLPCGRRSRSWQSSPGWRWQSCEHHSHSRQSSSGWQSQTCGSRSHPWPRSRGQRSRPSWLRSQCPACRPAWRCPSVWQCCPSAASPQET